MPQRSPPLPLPGGPRQFFAWVSNSVALLFKTLKKPLTNQFLNIYINHSVTEILASSNDKLVITRIIKMLITSQHYSDTYLQTYVLNTHTRTHKLNEQFYLNGEDSCDGNLSSSSSESQLSEFVCSSSRTNCTLPDVALVLIKVASHLKCSYFGSK